MDKLFKIRYFIVAFVLLDALVFAFLFGHKRELEKQYFSSEIQELRSDFRSIIRSYALASRLVFEEVINTPDVLEVLRGASGAGEAEKSRLRERLLLGLERKYERIKRNKIMDVQFYLPDNSIFLRLQNPGMFGDRNCDDTCPVRESIKAHQYREGFEVCNIYSGYKFSFPMFYEGRYLGSVLMGLTLDVFEAEMEGAFQGDIVFIIDKDIVEGEIFSNAGEMLDSLRSRYRDTALSDRHYAYSTGRKQAWASNEIDKRINRKAAALLPGGGTFTIPVKVGGDYHMASFIPISGSESENEGYMVSYGKKPILEVFEKDFYLQFSVVSLLVLMLVVFTFRINTDRAMLAQRVEKRTGDLEKANRELEHEIGERREAERKMADTLGERELLLREIHHRVKNNLAVIQSLLSLQSRRVRDDESREYFLESQNRIKAMSMIHERLYNSDEFSGLNFSEYISSLAIQLFRNYNLSASKVKLDIKVPDIMLDIDTMIPCGLIVNELISNAFKYAFPDGREGRVRIELKNGGDGRYTLTISDNGVGFPGGLDIHETESLGMQIVTSLIRQIHGTLELVHDGGATFIITFEDKSLRAG